MPKENKKVGMFQILGASVIRSFQGFFIQRVAWTEGYALPLVFYRLFIPAFLIYLYYLVKGDRLKDVFSKEKKLIHLLSATMAVRMFFFFLGYYYGGLVLGTVIFFSSSVFITFIETFFVRKVLDMKVLILSLTTFAGIVLIYFDRLINSHSSLLGVIYMTIAATLVIPENFMRKKVFSLVNSPIKHIFYQSVVGVILVTPTLFFFPSPGLYYFGWIIAFTIIIGIFAFALDIASHGHLNLAEINISRYLEPVGSILVGIFIFHEILPILSWVGVFVTLTSIFYLTYYNSRPRAGA